MKKSLAIWLIILILHIQYIQGQEGLPIYSDYLTDNYYLLHPSMAGIANCAQVRLTTRKNWVGEEDAPGLQTLGINSRVGQRSGIGGIAFIDKNGYHSQSGAYLTYAHHLMFTKDEVDLNMLSFGLSAGLIQYRLDQSEFVNGDPLIVGGIQSSVEYNVDAGFSYHLYDFYTHFTVKNILKNSGVNNDLQITSNLRRYLLSVGHVFSKPGNDWSYEPSFLLQYQEGTRQSSIDLNLKIYKELNNKNTLYAGISYRKSFDKASFLEGTDLVTQKLNYITPFVGIKYKKFTFAYTYTYQLNPIVFNHGGFHQLTLGFDFGCRKEKYDCNCPSIK